MLWERSLVMRDLETGSLWSHLLGKCMEGEKTGQELELLPASMTTWKGWKERHPETTVLAMKRTSNKFDLEVWTNPERFVYGVPMGRGKGVSAVSIAKLTETPVIQLSAKGDAVVTFEPVNKRAQAFDPRVEGKVQKFASSGPGRMKDAATGSEWDVVTGACVSGEMKGRVLRVKPGLISYKRAWVVFHPDSEVVE